MGKIVNKQIIVCDRISEPTYTGTNDNAIYLAMGRES